MKKYLTCPAAWLGVGLICLIGLIGLMKPISAQAEIIDGDLIRAQGTLDVFIVKIIGTEKFKRLILNPEIFNQYGHLKWENIKEVDQTTVDEYIVSDLVRAVEDDKVYKLYPNGDSGEKRWIKTADDFLNLGYKWTAIYTINNFERDFYSTGADLVYQVPQPPTPLPPARNPITINVPADYKTIQAAIDAAINGDTILASSGTYNENILINKNIKLISNYVLLTVIDGQGNGPAITIDGAGDFFIQRIVAKSKDEKAVYCKGENLSKGTIKNSTFKDSAWGIYADGNCNLTVNNNLIYNNKNSANTDGAGLIIKDNASYGIIPEILNNTIDDNYHGIWSENASLKVINSIITNNIGGKGTINNTGIYHSGSGSPDIVYSNAYGNSVDFGGDAKPGNGCIIVLPRFVYTPLRDYRLQTGTTEYSLCIDAGHPDHIYDDVDFRSNTARNDMGAYGGPDNIGWNP